MDLELMFGRIAWRVASGTEGVAVGLQRAEVVVAEAVAVVVARVVDIFKFDEASVGEGL